MATGFKTTASCPHKLLPVPIMIGDRWITPVSLVVTSYNHLSAVDVLIVLAPEHAPNLYDNGWAGTIMAIPIDDFGVMPSPTTFDHLLRRVYGLCKDYKVGIGCAGGHGRTGYFLASMIALIEVDAIDPIQDLRERVGCIEMVETLPQAEGIFSFRPEAMPENYYQEFALSDPTQWFGQQYPKQWTQSDWEKELEKQDALDMAKKDANYLGLGKTWSEQDKKETAAADRVIKKQSATDRMIAKAKGGSWPSKRGKGRKKGKAVGEEVGKLSDCSRCGYTQCICFNT